ncbi:MAG: cyclic nucleotide-binding domain-containing protein [Sediminibacterium sp.]
MIEFFNYLNSLHSLSSEATAALLKVMRAKELRRGQVWLQEGAVCDKFSFVVKGLMKQYFETGSKEVIICFARENEIIFSVQSYFKNTPSPHTIRAVEQSVVVYVLRSEFEHLMERHGELMRHYVLMVQERACQMEQHVGVLLLPSKERYESLAAASPWMVEGRLTDRMLYGYLGVGCNGLGRWRKGG